MARAAQGGGGKGVDKHPPPKGKADKGGGGKSVGIAAAALPPKGEGAPVETVGGGEEVEFAEGKENDVHHAHHARGVDESLDEDDLDIQSECVRLISPCCQARRRCSALFGFAKR